MYEFNYSSLLTAFCIKITDECCFKCKGYLHYKTKTSKNVSSEAQVKIFFYFIEKLCPVLEVSKVLLF